MGTNRARAVRSLWGKSPSLLMQHQGILYNWWKVLPVLLAASTFLTCGSSSTLDFEISIYVCPCDARWFTMGVEQACVLFICWKPGKGWKRADWEFSPSTWIALSGSYNPRWRVKTPAIALSRSYNPRWRVKTPNRLFFTLFWAIAYPGAIIPGGGWKLPIGSFSPFSEQLRYPGVIIQCENWP